MSQDQHFPAQRQSPPGATDAMTPEPDCGEADYVGTEQLTARRALVTGGDSGIGRAVAIAFAREGCDVALSYLPEEEQDARTTARWVHEAGRRCALLPGDLRDEATARGVVHRAAGELGGLDVLVNNAGHQMARRGSVEDMTTEELDRVLKTNLYALFWVTQSALKYLERGGAIINTSSIQAYRPSGTLLDYAATKAAINNVTVNLAAELGPRGIRVNAVVPGPVWTPLQPATQPAEKIPAFGTDTPLGRAAQPAEVAPAFVFLASSRTASYVSGTVLGVTGGHPVF